MFDYNNHTDHNDSLTAVITASNLDFDTDIMFDNDTFSMDNGNLLAQFSTMHQAEELRGVSFMKHDESLYAYFPQSYVNKIHIDFLENFMKASVVIKAPSVEEEVRLIQEITKMLEPQVVSAGSEDGELKNAEQHPVANTFLDPAAPSITFADAPKADAEFHNLLAPSDVSPTDSSKTDDVTEQYDMPAPDITDKLAEAEQHPVANTFLDPAAPSITFADAPEADAEFHNLLALSDVSPTDSSKTDDVTEQYDMPAPVVTDRLAEADDKTPAEKDSAQYDMPAPDITGKLANVDDKAPTDTEKDSAHDLRTPEIAAPDSLKQPADSTDDTKDEDDAKDEDDIQQDIDLHLAALYDSIFW